MFGSAFTGCSTAISSSNGGSPLNRLLNAGKFAWFNTEQNGGGYWRAGGYEL